MSVDLVKTEIARFLKDDRPGVLCIRGKWGVGKTHAWKEALKAALSEKRLGLLKYAYVSLFGLNSLEAFKYAVFENSQNIEKGVRDAGFETLEDFVGAASRWRPVLKALTSGAMVTRWLGPEGVQALSFLAVRKQIVCIDDFERRGKSLDAADALGLASFLRQERDCKVVLILNEEKLDKESRSDFDRHLEKVVDVSLAYDPSPAMAAKIGAGGDSEAERLVAERCVALGITNVRVIRRVLRLVETVLPKLADYDAEVARMAAAALTLFCWSHDQPDEAPPLDYLENRMRDMAALDRKPPDGTDKAGWMATLDAYGYRWTDAFDLALIDAVRKGYFDDDRLAREAAKLHAKLVKSHAEGSFESAWRRFHDSFADDQDETLDGIRDAFAHLVEHLTPTDLNGAVALFKRLGRPEEATAMLAQFIEAHGADRALFDLSAYPFSQHVDDPDVQAAFAAKLAQEAPPPADVASMLDGIAEGWSPERLEALAAAPVEEYRRAFKSRRGAGLRTILAAALQFARIGNATPPMQEITRRAKLALRAIGGESPINALRVIRLGVAPEPRPAAQDQAPPVEDAPPPSRHA
ncbi:MAG: hypothetical protein ACLPGW_14405 [Roseiarcus sp.]